MEKIIENLIIRTTKMVKKCPIYGIEHIREFEYDRCTNCTFIVDKESGKCGWYEYITSLIEKSSITDEDEYGGMPSTAYFKTIKCANCGSGIKFHSGFSELVKGDYEICKKCKLRHVFKEFRNGQRVFAIPISQLEKINE